MVATAIGDRLNIVNAASPQTLTFLFTDIEGSTPLWDREPDAMREATERHNAMLRAAIASRGGHAFRVVGDAFCVAFADAGAAILAAVEAQLALRAHPWAAEASIHVRMGLHSGAVESFRTLQDRNCGAYSAEAHAAALFAQGDNAAVLHEAEAAAAAFRELGAVRHHALASVLGLIVSLRLALGDRVAARQALRDALSVQRQTSRDRPLPRLLEKVAAMHPDPGSAPALLGSAAALREQRHVPVVPAEREEYANCYAAVRAMCGAETFDRGVVSGQMLTRDEAIDRALMLLEGNGPPAPR